MFGIPFILPMLAIGQDAEAGLPACCRRNGKHHCSFSMDEQGKMAVSHDAQFKAPVPKCPFLPSSVVSAQPNQLAAPTVAGAIFADLVSHPTGVVQTEAKRRISRSRSHQKRGPPALTNL